VFLSSSFLDLVLYNGITDMKNGQVSFRSTSDGWRGKLAQNFTYENVKQIAEAISIYLIKNMREQRLVIGYDTRFMSKDFAIFMSSVFQQHGINVTIIRDPSTTPLLSFTTYKYKFPLGINITASHNPPFDNGIKIRMNYGGTPSEEIVAKIESYLNTKPRSSKIQGKVIFVNPRKNYAKTIRKLAGISKAKNSRIKVLVDTMYGSSRGLLKEVFNNSKVQIDYLHENYDPYFGGMNPEPKFESTTELQDIIKKGKYSFGIAHDGDGDRIVAVLPKIGYLSPHEISALLVLYLGKYKQFKGKVLGSSTLGRRVKRVCETLGLTYETMPVGFKNATKQMLEGKVLVAAEENGGVGFGFYVPERDATLAATILVDAEATIGLANLFKELEKIAGRSGFCRYNFTPSVNRENLFSMIIKDTATFNYKEIESVNKSDGVKVIYKNGDWLSIRYSGTEDILRIYCESDTRGKAVKIKNFALKCILEIERRIK